MTRAATYSHEFVDAFPRNPAAGVLYVSLTYATTMHLCMCGCGNEVIAPLHPTDWTAHFDGRTVSLTPSIGNWALPCQSHYILMRGNVRWARRWTRSEIEAGRARDRRAKALTYDDAANADPTDEVTDGDRDRWLDRWW